LREGPSKHQGGYRCRPTRVRFKIIRDAGTAEAPSMSAAGRFALFISGLVAATSLLSSRTALDATKSPGSAPVWMAVEKPPAMPVEPTVVTLAEHSEWRPVSLGLPRAPLDREAIVRQLQSE